MNLDKPITLDLLDVKAPALHATSDMPVVETKPDAQNEGKPPAPRKTESDVKAAPDEGKTKAGESATPPAESAADEPPAKPARGVQKRLDELTREREEARRLAETERQEKLRLLALLEAKPKAEPEKPRVEEDLVRPSRTEFSDPDAYDQALEAYFAERSARAAEARVEARLAEERKSAEQKAIEAGQTAARAAYAQRVEKAREKYSDYSEVAESPDVQVSVPVAQAILNTDYGPDIAYYLGKNPQEASRIFQLNPVHQIVELGVIVAKLNGTTQAAAPAPSLSKAPPPLKPLGAGSESTDKSLDDLSVEEYAAKWRERPENRRRPGMRQ